MLSLLVALMIIVIVLTTAIRVIAFVVETVYKATHRSENKEKSFADSDEKQG